MKRIELWTDGSGSYRDRVGGWAFVIIEGKEIVHEDLGGEYDTTTQRMEQTAVLKGLSYIKKSYDEPVQIFIYSDSAYVVNCFIDRWYDRWIENEWLGVKNSDIWKKLLKFRGDRKFRMFFNHVKGHSGIEYNERCDYLAGQARKEFLKHLQS